MYASSVSVQSDGWTPDVRLRFLVNQPASGRGNQLEGAPERLRRAIATGILASLWQQTLDALSPAEGATHNDTQDDPSGTRKGQPSRRKGQQDGAGTAVRRCRLG